MALHKTASTLWAGTLQPLWQYSNTLNPLMLGGAALAFHFLCLIIYRLYFHPLAKFPGPFLAKLTEWQLAYNVLQGQGTAARSRWFQKYGNVVRVAPNELQFCDAASVKEIYGQGSTMPPKYARFYHPFSVTGQQNILSSSNGPEHSRIRRLLSHAFSYKNVITFEDRLAGKVRTFIDIIYNAKSTIDIYHLIHHLYLDTISDLGFDKAFGCLEDDHIEESADAERTLMITAMKGIIPFVELLPLQFIREAVRARPRIIKFATTCVRDLSHRVLKGEVADSSLLERMMKTNDKGEMLSELELVENAIIFIQAGAGTSHVTLVYFLWHVHQHPEVRSRLVREIRDAFPDKNTLPDFGTLVTLPYLEKVWNEVLRLQAPLASTIQRVSPGKTIGGHYIPNGVVVSNLAYQTHRDPNVFPNPAAFDPNRWDAPTPEMRTMFRPFSLGPRNCIGLHLAKMQVFLAVGAMYQRFDVTVDPTVTPETMLVEDRGILLPKRQSFRVEFRRSQQDE